MKTNQVRWMQVIRFLAAALVIGAVARIEVGACRKGRDRMAQAQAQALQAANPYPAAPVCNLDEVFTSTR